LELEVEWAKVKAQQVEETPFALSMNAMAEALKVMQDLVVSERKPTCTLFRTKKGS
jgi:hypothetical protein